MNADFYYHESKAKNCMCNSIESVGIILFFRHMLHSQLIYLHFGFKGALANIYYFMALNVVFQCSGVRFPNFRLVCTIAVCVSKNNDCNFFV